MPLFFHPGAIESLRGECCLSTGGTTLGGTSTRGSPMARQFGKAFLGPGPGRESAAGGNAAGSRQIPLWGPIVWQYHLTHCPWICPQEGGTRTKGKGAILSASPATLPERVAMGRPILRGVLATMNSAFQAAASMVSAGGTTFGRVSDLQLILILVKFSFPSTGTRTLRARHSPDQRTVDGGEYYRSRMLFNIASL